jgi:hypothetical protein
MGSEKCTPLFEWDALGYHANQASAHYPDDVSVPPGSDPWLVLDIVLTHVKRGNFRSLSRLFSYVNMSVDPIFWIASAQLLGDAGPVSMLRRFIGQYEAEINNKTSVLVQAHICNTLHQSLLLWTVPLMLEMYLRSVSRRELGFVPIFLSRILEEEMGPIFVATDPDPEYRQLVIDRFQELKDGFGTDNVPVSYGAKFSVPTLAARLLKYVTSIDDDFSPVTVMRDRHILEASTGLDCRGFFRDGVFEPLSTAAILEEFLLQLNPSTYEEGARYFFGHRIPD